MATKPDVGHEGQNGNSTIREYHGAVTSRARKGVDCVTDAALVDAPRHTAKDDCARDGKLAEEAGQPETETMNAIVNVRGHARNSKAGDAWKGWCGGGCEAAAPSGV